MNWKHWIETHIPPGSFEITIRDMIAAFPLEVATYTITKLGPDGNAATNTKQMTLANLDVQAVDAHIRVSWDYGLTVTMPAIQVEQGSVAFMRQDIISSRKLSTRIVGINGETGEPETRDTNVYSLAVLEGDGLLIIEMLDMKESLGGETAKIVVAKA